MPHTQEDFFEYIFPKKYSVKHPELKYKVDYNEGTITTSFEDKVIAIQAHKSTKITESEYSHEFTVTYGNGKKLKCENRPTVYYQKGHVVGITYPTKDQTWVAHFGQNLENKKESETPIAGYENNQEVFAITGKQDNEEWIIYNHNLVNEQISIAPIQIIKDDAEADSLGFTARGILFHGENLENEINTGPLPATTALNGKIIEVISRNGTVYYGEGLSEKKEFNTQPTGYWTSFINRALVTKEHVYYGPDFDKKVDKDLVSFSSYGVPPLATVKKNDEDVILETGEVVWKEFVSKIKIGNNGLEGFKESIQGLKEKCNKTATQKEWKKMSQKALQTIGVLEDYYKISSR